MGKGLPRSLKRAQFNQTGNGLVKVTFPVRNVTLSVADGAPGFGTVVIGDLPQGDLLLLGAVSYMQFTNIGSNLIATWAGNYAIGVDPTADNVLSASPAAEVQIVDNVAIAAAVAGVSAMTRSASTTAQFAGAVLLNNRDGAMELNLNVLIADASISGAASLRVNGALHMAYVQLGDS